MRDGQQNATRPKLGRPFKTKDVEPPPQMPIILPPLEPIQPIEDDNASTSSESSMVSDVSSEYQQSIISNEEIENQKPIRSTRNVPHPKYQDYVWAAPPEDLSFINSSISLRQKGPKSLLQGG